MDMLPKIESEDRAANLTKDELLAFESRVAEAFADAKIRGPVHLSGGNENELIDLFKQIDRDDWVFSTYRNHYHALLHGIDPEWLMSEILAGRSMNITNVEHRFFTSAIVGGTLPIAVGVAAALKRLGASRRVWCFVGDMAGTTGAFHEARQYAVGHDLPIMFVIENNGLSCNSPTIECWGPPGTRGWGDKRLAYNYTRKYPHVGVGHFVQF